MMLQCPAIELQSGLGCCVGSIVAARGCRCDRRKNHGASVAILFEMFTKGVEELRGTYVIYDRQISDQVIVHQASILPGDCADGQKKVSNTTNRLGAAFDKRVR